MLVELSKCAFRFIIGANQMLTHDMHSGDLSGSNVVSLLNCMHKGDRTSLIFEFVEGRDFIKDLPKLTERDVARYMMGLFIALAHAHR
jgi:serine/threonine protein kinase